MVNDSEVKLLESLVFSLERSTLLMGLSACMKNGWDLEGRHGWERTSQDLGQHQSLPLVALPQWPATHWGASSRPSIMVVWVPPVPFQCLPNEPATDTSGGLPGTAALLEDGRGNSTLTPPPITKVKSGWKPKDPFLYLISLIKKMCKWQRCWHD